MSELTFGLLAIVKDEEKSIERMLRSCLDVGIRHWVITDTGSSDNTLALAQGMAHDNLYGHGDARFYNYPWFDFSTNRNGNLERAFDDFPQVDYWLALDADETVEDVGGPPTCEGRLGMYHLPERMDNEEPPIVFQAPRLIKGGSDFRYRGRCHEVLCSPTVQPVGLAQGWFLHHWDNGRYSIMGDKARFQRNLELLKRDLKDPNCDQARTLFYLAMTYEKGGYNEKAAEYFARRYKMEGTWEEERWMAHFRMGCCQLRMGKTEGVDTLLQCLAERPWRAEPLMDLAAYYHGRGLDQLSSMFLPQGPFPYPVQDTLFLRDDLYAPPPLTSDPVTVTTG